MREPEARASWRAPRPTRSSPTASDWCVAILDHRVVDFRYQGHDRTVEPHLLGLHEAGEPLLVAYQTAGGSQSGRSPAGGRSSRPRWRTSMSTTISSRGRVPTSTVGAPHARDLREA